AVVPHPVNGYITQRAGASVRVRQIDVHRVRRFLDQRRKLRLRLRALDRRCGEEMGIALRWWNVEPAHRTRPWSWLRIRLEGAPCPCPAFEPAGVQRIDVVRERTDEVVVLGRVV